jgi:glutathione S-transferase
MTHKVKLYMFTGSTPSLTARLMLEHKGVEHARKHVMVGPHAFAMLGRRFQTMTVPALKVDGRRVQGSREISRALDELVEQPRLFPEDPQRRSDVERAERRGEELQDVARRIFWCVARRDPRAFHRTLRHQNVLMRLAQRAMRRPVTWLATAGHRATDRICQEDLALLPERLDEIDRWIEQGLLGGEELNAADFQIAPNVMFLLCFEDLAPFIEQRPAARLAQRVCPQAWGALPKALPRAWQQGLR